ncbi:hypothetical protein ACFOON_05740 [Novosphingobium piscinae]|uniref:Uncharacterized protein n=1 Tax=Novosphingobium piscinae TaxID=1507448 RepID=A0A7X1G0E3_9SPHN|nr:hypothetical protein [Novosphingobium piscinae]MBC2669632.1 hypothetical protein [Novosphingobium piscinae]
MTASEPAIAGQAPAPAFLRVGGALVARHQVALALAAGCRRIVVIARDFTAEFASLQRDAEEAGASFHVVAAATGLTGLVTAADEVLALAEGLLPTPGDALPLFASGQGVIVLPADHGTAAGFERIDLAQAWAGMMLVPGRLVDRLMDLPADVDAVSALLRIALQAGVSLRPVPEAVRSGGRWLLIRNEVDAQAAEEGWMVRHTADGPGTPGPAMARLLVRHFGAAMLHEGSSRIIGLGLSGLLAILALAAGWFGSLVGGFALLAAAEVVLGTSLLLVSLHQGALRQGPRRLWASGAAGVAFDLALVALLVLALPLLPGQTLAERGFPAVVLLGLLRVLPRVLPGRVMAWLEDRLVLTALFAVLAAGHVLAPAILGMSLVLLMAALVLIGRRDAAKATIITGA